ncbi:unnamed protein product [Fusarium venenatum]|uniref:Uncharacterized protein n=1 Tax=Fusarium venenatum TaxID=56646 RepID=A0A2L2SNK5_9HYPO|nr:LOW QUALITY PROTEIN: uncharacterized protein FVRRES_11837 [Fusarium venenatum]CEI39146.1 unnamed protein product [Fusarium venenatum]
MLKNGSVLAKLGGSRVFKWPVFDLASSIRPRIMDNTIVKCTVFVGCESIKASWNWKREADDLTVGFCSIRLILDLLYYHHRSTTNNDIVDTSTASFSQDQHLIKALRRPCTSKRVSAPTPRLSSFPARLGVLLITVKNQDSGQGLALGQDRVTPGTVLEEEGRDYRLLTFDSSELQMLPVKLTAAQGQSRSEAGVQAHGC